MEKKAQIDQSDIEARWTALELARKEQILLALHGLSSPHSKLASKDKKSIKRALPPSVYGLLNKNYELQRENYLLRLNLLGTAAKILEATNKSFRRTPISLYGRSLEQVYETKCSNKYPEDLHIEFLEKISDRCFRRELNENREVLSDIFGYPCKISSYSLNKRIIGFSLTPVIPVKKRDSPKYEKATALFRKRSERSLDLLKDAWEFSANRRLIELQ